VKNIWVGVTAAFLAVQGELEVRGKMEGHRADGRAQGETE
jgi:hypothetical protein